MLPLFNTTASNGLLNSVFLLTSVLLFHTVVAPTSAQNPLKDNSPDCSCYVTSGSSASYFNFHRFHDFRALPGSHIDIPSTLISGQDSGTEDTTSPFFDGLAWNADWHIQNWWRNATADGTVKMVNSAQNVYIGTITIS